MSGRIQFTAEELCDGLDQLCIQQLELMDQLIKDNMMLEESMRGGFFLLSKTRYSLGTHAVSALQLPSEDREVKALAEVVSSPVTLEGSGGDLMYHRVEAKFRDPILQVNGDNCEVSEEDDTSQHCDDSLYEGLRKRLSYATGEQQGEEVNECEDGESKLENSSRDGDESKTKVINRDPIRWFSTLPPQTLRQAQKDFKTGICLVAACATTQLKLRAANKEFRRLYEIKSKLDKVEKET